MVASYNDKQILSGEPTFQSRVRQALVSASISIENENSDSVPFHRERETFAVACVNSPDTYKTIVAIAVANDASVIGDATAGGTVALTSANVAAQQALVTDAHLDTAIASTFNGFFRTPST